MRIVKIGDINEECVLALGNFDGLHIAHAEVIRDCVSEARKRRLSSGVLLFDRHSDAALGRSIRLLTDFDEKIRLIEGLGVDFVCILPFDEAVMHLSPEDFLELLITELHTAAVCVGYNYRFGYKACGDTELLKKYMKKRGVDVKILPQLIFEGEAVSSTRIRKLISEGDMQGAAALLGRHYSISGRVVKGLQNGHLLGFPTANIQLGEDKILPCDGVYKTYAYVGGRKYRAIANIGKNPSFAAQKRTSEVHILDFDGDLYGCDITAELLEKIRDDIKFSSLEQLKKQIASDIKRAWN